MIGTGGTAVAKTREELFEVMSGMQARGQKITNATVLAVVGGSLSDICPHVKTFKTEHKIGARPQESAAAQAATPPGAVPVPPAIQRVIDAVAAAMAPLPGEVDRLRAEIIDIERQHNRAEIAAVSDAAAIASKAMQAELDDAQETVTGLGEECEVLKASAAARQLELDEITAAKDKLNLEVKKLAADLEREQEARKAAETQVESLGKAVTEAQKAEAGERATAKAAESEAARVREQLKDREADLKKAEGTAAALQTELAVALKGEQTEARRADKAEAEIERVRAKAEAEKQALRSELRSEAETEIERVRANAEAEKQALRSEIEALRSPGEHGHQEAKAAA